MKKIKLLLAATAAMFSLSASAQSWTGSDPAAGTFFLYNVGAGKFINVGDKSAGWGTNAYLTAEYGLDFTFEANGSAYNLNTQVSNGGANYYLVTELWCDGAATPWTFTKVDRTDINAYTISNGGSYIVANAAGTDIEYVALSGTERDQWQLIGSTDILANLQANTAAGVKRTQATFFISDPDFGRNDLRMSADKKVWNYTRDGGNVTIPGRGLGLGGDGNVSNYGCEFWDNTFDIHQDLTNLPNGIYEFEIYGYGTKGTTYIYATTAGGTTEKVFKNQTGASNFQTALNNIDNYGGNVTGLVQVTDGTLTIGVKRETNSGGDWTVIDQARLYYYGDYTFAEAYGADLKDLIASAQALVNAAPAFLSTTALETAISTAQGVMSTGTTETEFSTATTDLQSAIDTYNAQLTLVSRYADIRTAALAIASGMDVTAADAAAAAATNSDEIAAAIATLRAAFLAELPNVTVSTDGLDVTAVMVDNASVAQNTNYWTIANLSENGGSAGVCNYGECEFYNRNFKFFQTLALTPGTWEFGVTGFHRAGNHSTYFYAGEDKILIPGVESSVVNDMAGAKTYFDNGNGKVALKFLIESAGDVEIGIDNQDTETDKWTIFRNFTLKYYGAPDYSVYDARLSELAAEAAAVEGTVPATVYTALNGVVTENNTTHANKAEYMTAISNIEAAIATAKTFAAPYGEYQAVKAKVEAMKSVEGYTETTSGATTTLTSAVAAADEAVNAATTAEAIAEQVTALKTAGKTFIGGVRSDGAHPFDITFLITNPSFDNNDATGWTATPAPGFQSYTNCEYYFGNTRTFDINQTLTDMPKGNYELKVQAFQRPGWFEAVYDAYKAGNNKVTSVIYINDGQTTIKNLVSEGATTSDAQWQNNNDSNKDGKYYANSMNGASKAFAAGYYWNTVLTAVEGDLKFGFKTTSESVDGDWTIFDNFQLYYYGNSINVTMDEAQAFSALADIEGANVTMARTTKEGYNTVALPFDLTEAQVKEVFGDGAEVYAYSENSADVEDATVNFTKAATAIEANVPVLVKATKAAAEIKVDNVTVKTGEAKVEGTLLDFVGNYGGQITLPADVWFVGNGALYESTGNTTMKGFRAYIAAKSAEIKEQVGDVKLFIDGLATRVSEINGMAAENGVIYNVAGQRVNKAQKGIFIVNGKKVVK